MDYYSKYCAENNLKTVSESTIGNIIKRHKLFYQKSGKIYHNPNSKWAQGSLKMQKRLKEFGHMVTDGIKDYFYSAIAAKLKFALTLNYKRLNSRNKKDFYKRFNEVYPLTIKS